MPRRAEIDSFFTCQHPDQFAINWRAFYERAEQRTDDVRSNWPHELDLAYGPAQRHRLDLYLPRGASGSVPVLLFLHGGGFREGDPTLYGYLAQPFVERGIAFASVGYRLTPETYLPDTFDDVADAVAWCVQNFPSRGVDVGRIALSGHSAGAILTAYLAGTEGWRARRSLPADVLKAAIPISGLYDLSDAAHGYMIKNGTDPVESSPLRHVQTTPPPMLVAWGGQENRTTFAVDGPRLADAARARGGQAEVLELAGMTHADTADALGDPSSALFQSVLPRVTRLAVASP
ncbi:MAG TPA: alpha/beta hydrolase [Chloroflexota bacterium]